MSGSNKLSFTWAAGLGLAAMLAAPTQAQYVFDGSKVRVNMSNSLVMLSQQISAAACNAKVGMDATAAREELKAARSDFRLILDGLANGAPALGIPTEETSPRVLRSLASVEEIWAEVDQALETASQSQDGDAMTQVIRLSQEPLLDVTSILASDVLNGYSSPFEMTQRDALSLNFAGRQRMLGYQMSRSICGILGGLEDFGTPETLDEYASLFDISLMALKDGMPEAGVQPPPSDLVESMLTEASTQWSSVKPIVETAVDAGKASEDAASALNNFVSDTKLLMDNTVTLYMLANGDGGDVYKVALEEYARTEVPKWLDQPILIDALRAQNGKHATLTQAEVDELDLIWRAQMKEGGGELVSELVDRPLSDWFRERVDATAGLVVEIFATDNIGLNVGQSNVTGDYWQGDEAKYEQTIKYGQGTIHFSDMELDVENGVYQAQISAPVKDPETGEWIGVMIFSVNVQSLL